MGGHINTYETLGVHTNHIRDDLKKYKVNIPWDTEEFKRDGSINSKSVQLKGTMIKALRQHAKAIGFNYNEIVPLDTSVSDEEIDTEHIKADNINEETEDIGTGLLDIMVENGIMDLGGVTADGSNPDGVEKSTLITKEKLSSIGRKIQAASQYANYSNHANTGYGKHYNGYSNHSNTHSNHNNNYAFCHGNHNNHSNTGTYLNQGNSYGLYDSTGDVLYSDSFTDPAEYKDSL